MSAVSQSHFLQALGWAIINSLWQMALLWMIYQLILGFSKISAANKTRLATGFVTAGFIWFLYTFIASWLFSPTSNPISRVAQEIVSVETWNNWLQKIIPFASVVYLLLLFIPTWQFIRNYRFVQLIRNYGLSKIDIDWRIFVKKTAGYMGIKRPVHIWLSELVSSPVTIGYLKPIILIPVAAISHLSTQQVEAVILHELSHIRRFDYLFNLIINFIKTFLYFNPFVRLFVRSIELERENSCDEMVIQFRYQPYDYASALLLLEKNAAQRPPMLMAAGGSNNDLLQRVEKIMGIGKRKFFSARQMAGTMVMLLAVFTINAIVAVNTQKNTGKFLGFTTGYNPYYFFSNAGNNGKLNPGTTKTDIAKQKTSPVTDENSPDDVDLEVTPPDASDFSFVNYITPVVPELAPEEEEKVKETINATKKVLEEIEWKELEKGYAEVFNSTEKAKIHNEYLKGLNSVDWNKLENQLKLAYNNLDWPKINGQIKTSLAEIKLDSIQQVINITLADLGKVETWLKENKTTSVPDTDITLQFIKDNQQKAKAQLDKIKTTRSKKVVRI